MKTELFENADVTVSVYHPSKHALGSLGITRGHFDGLFSCIEVRMSNIVIEYRIPLSNSEFRRSQRFRVDGDVDLFYIWIRKDAFSRRSRYVLTGPNSSPRQRIFFLYSSKIIYKQFIRSTIPIQNY